VSSKDEYDDLSDLNTMEMDSVREWEMQFKGEGQYPYIKHSWMLCFCMFCV